MKRGGGIFEKMGVAGSFNGDLCGYVRVRADALARTDNCFENDGFVSGAERANGFL